jgi:hypothetical protein
MNSNQQKVISYHGLTLNLASVKCFKLPMPIDKSKEVIHRRESGKSKNLTKQQK